MATRKSGIPVKSSISTKGINGPIKVGQTHARQSNIPVKLKTEASKIADNAKVSLSDRIKHLESEVEEKNSTIKELNEKLTKISSECEVLREENEKTEQNFCLPTNAEISEMKELQESLHEKEKFIENMLVKRKEVEKQLENEKMVKGEHEADRLSLQKERESLQMMLENEKTITSELRDKIKQYQQQITSTKSQYENEISTLKQKLESDRVQLENLEKKREESEKISEDKLSTLNYQIQEKNVLISDLQHRLNHCEEITANTKQYSDEDVMLKLNDLRQQLTTEHENSLESANSLWRQKLEEHEKRETDKTLKYNDESNDELLNKISELKQRLKDADEAQEEQSTILETQEEEIDELRESNRAFEEKYTSLYEKMEEKWALNESEIVQQIKNHYDFEIERLHAQLENIEKENTNLKTELDIMNNDGGKILSPRRRTSVSARIEMKEEIEEYKVMLATLERDLQHALHENERLKLENNIAKNDNRDDPKLQERIDKHQLNNDNGNGESKKLKSQLDESIKYCKKLEKDIKRQEERIVIVEKNKDAKIDEITKANEEKVSELMKIIDDKNVKSKESSKECERINEELRKRELEIKVIEDDFQKKEHALLKKCEDAEEQKLKLKDELKKVKSTQDKHMDEVNKLTEQERRSLEEKVAELENKISQGKVASEALQMKYEKLKLENDSKTSQIDEFTKIIDNMKVNDDEAYFKELKNKYEEMSEENKKKDGKIFELEQSYTKKDDEFQQLAKDFSELQTEVEIYKSKMKYIKETKNKVKELDICEQNEKKRNQHINISPEEDQEHGCENKLSYEEMKDKYQRALVENDEKISTIESLESDNVLLRKKITAFEKKVTTTEREKKNLEEKTRSLDSVIEEQEKKMRSLKDKLESYDWKNGMLERELSELKSLKDTLNNYSLRNKDLSVSVEEITSEKTELATKYSKLIQEHKELQDTLQDNKKRHENNVEQENSENKRKMETFQKKLNEKDRVLNETKKKSRQLKENEKILKDELTESKKHCSKLEMKIEEIENVLKCVSQEKEELKKELDRVKDKNETESSGLKELNLVDAKKIELLKQQLLEMKRNMEKKESSMKDKMATHKKELEQAQKTVEGLNKNADMENENTEKLQNNVMKLSEENHFLKMKMEELKTEIIKGKKDGNMMERLKDGLRLEVENLHEKLNNAIEKISTLQSKQLHDEEEGIKEKKKLLKNLKEYESRNGELILDIDRASKSLNLTKEKYGQLKDRFRRLTKKYTEICEEKLNKSDVKVGPDTSEDLSLIVEDLQRSKDNAERENSKLRTKMDGLLEEIGRSEYQIKSVRKANVVLMKQTRCLYEESEQQKRIDEEKTKELQEYRRINQSLKDQEKSWQNERKKLIENVNALKEEKVMLKEKNDEYHVAKNKTEIELREKIRECTMNSWKLEQLRNEKEFHIKSQNKIDQNINLYDSFGNESISSQRNESLTAKEFERASTYANGKNIVELTTPVFNNDRVHQHKAIESEMNDFDTKSIVYLNNNKDTNLQMTRNIINNDFGSDRYLGKTYWETLEFLKKK